MFYKKDEILFRDSRFLFAFLLLSILIVFMATSYKAIWRIPNAPDVSPDKFARAFFCISS